MAQLQCKVSAGNRQASQNFAYWFSLLLLIPRRHSVKEVSPVTRLSDMLQLVVSCEGDFCGSQRQANKAYRTTRYGTDFIENAAPLA